jgi:GST-like protein
MHNRARHFEAAMLESRMSSLSAFPITSRWPAAHPERLQLYSLPTPNGVKVSIMLEEIGLPYEPHRVDFDKNEQKTPEFLSLNPNGKIPAIIDPDGPGGKPLGLFESGAILQYLGEKTGKLLPADAARRYETLQWVYFQMAFVGPMFGQVGYFHKFAGREIADKRPLEHYVAESKRLLSVIDDRLAGRQWIMGDDYTIADISILGWVRNLSASMGHATSWRSIPSATSRLGWSAALRGPPLSAGCRSRSAPEGQQPGRQDACASAASLQAVTKLRRRLLA